jgi:4-hydroxymandelate oxidase
MRAETAGCRALVVTVDVPRMGRRLRDIRSGFTLPIDVIAANLPAAATELARQHIAGASSIITHTSSSFEPALSWSHLGWLRERTDLPIILKGVLHPLDAARAAELGVAGLIVSNHGGRQLDGAVASMTALPAVRDAVAGRCALLLDGGVRGGTDVLKALATGAAGVLVGRPALWGLAVGGYAGARRVLSLLRNEMEDAMALAGCPDVDAAASAMLATTLGDPR